MKLRKCLPMPAFENLRVKSLEQLLLLDTGPEPAFDEILSMAVSFADVPIGAISLVDSNRQWFKAKIGIEANETTREISFCAHAILSPEKILMIRDARLDNRFRKNPLVTGDFGLRAYAGIPLSSPITGMSIGALCVIDRQPRSFEETKLCLLRDLGRKVELAIARRLEKLAAS